jgi:hypothetical protein
VPLTPPHITAHDDNGLSHDELRSFMRSIVTGSSLTCTWRRDSGEVHEWRCVVRRGSASYRPVEWTHHRPDGGDDNIMDDSLPTSEGLWAHFKKNGQPAWIPGKIPSPQHVGEILSLVVIA